MAINKQVSLKWKNETHNILITMEVIDRLDDAVNLVTIVKQYEDGDVRFTKVAKLIRALLNEAGVETDDGEVFHALFGSGDIKHSDLAPMMTAIFSAIFPEPKKKATSTKSKKLTGRAKKT